MTLNTKVKTVRFNARYSCLHTETSQYPVQRSVIKTLTRTRTGEGVIDFKGKIRRHESATSSLTAENNVLANYGGSGGGSLSYHHSPALGFVPSAPVVKQQVWGDFWPYRAVQPQMKFNWSSDADGRARNKFLSQVRKTQTAVSGMTFLGEMRQTLNMLRKPGAGLWNALQAYYDALRKRKRADPVGWAKAIHELWLEQSFGWRPLMMDIAGGFDALNSLLEKSDYTVSVMGSAQSSKLIANDRYVAGYDAYVPYLWFVGGNKEEEQETVRYKGDVVVRVATTFGDKAARWGFTPSDFVPTLWELLPWSFLVDYFVTIGDALDAYYANTSTVGWVNKTIRHRGKTLLTIGLDTAQTQNAIPLNCRVGVTAESPAMMLWERTTITRSSYTGMLPSLSIRYDGPKWGQYANMSALFGQFCSNLHTQNPSKRNYRL